MLLYSQNMKKEDLNGVLSLSCVENYFLAYFKDCFDVRTLYVQSYRSVNSALEDCIVKGQSYENCLMTRLQDTAETLKLAAHTMSKKLDISENKLNLIRVNKNFFNGFKIAAWRDDHYIAVEKESEGIRYLNNYPLSDGLIAHNEMEDIYDNATLCYFFIDKFDFKEYERLADLQFNSIIHSEVKDVRITEENLSAVRNAILVLRTVRKRLIEWLRLESERKGFIFDCAFEDITKNLLDGYERLFSSIELQIMRKKLRLESLQEKLDAVAEREREMIRSIKLRRVKNEYV